jgi:hypothetical protein
VGGVLTDTPVKAALEAEVETHSKPIKRNRLFSYSQEKTRKSKQLKKNVRRVESCEEDDGNECFCVECVEPYFMSRAATEWFQCIKFHDGPTTVAPNLATFMFVGTATLLTILMT